ncbi:MAG: hypothetical protein ABIZ50_05635, partial [Solirubrobacterales bacterium]
MSLSVISGPPGSGREEEILDRFEAVVGADPVLVVPTRDDVDRLERDLCGRGSGGLLGGTVTSFPGLSEEVARALGTGGKNVATGMQRLWLARAAARRAPLRLLRRSAAREGFAAALEATIADLQAAGLDSEALEAATAELPERTYELEICALFAAYEERRDSLGLSDAGLVAARTTAKLRADPRSWRERPVLLLGFDDLSRQQIELVAALQGACDVTVAITFEGDRPALAARAGLRGVLIDELGGVAEPPRQRFTPARGASALHHIERHLFDAGSPSVSPDASIHLLEGAGERNEAELIGRRIARLIASGCDPDDIAIAVRSPDRQAQLIARVLAGLGIPVSAEAEVPLAGTATGSALFGLLEIAGPGGTASGVVAFLRGPARAHPESVDWLERRVLRGRLETATEALDSWRGGEERDRRIWELDAIREAASNTQELLSVLARLAADVAER